MNAENSRNTGRIRNQRVPIDYEETCRFFKGRAASGKDKIVQVLYQDQNPALAHARAETEFDTLSRIVAFEGRDVLDIGCGNGRLAERLIDRVSYYFGFDLVSEFVETATASLAARGVCSSRYKFTAAPCNAEVIDTLTSTRQFDVFLMSGVSIYLNDDDFSGSLKSIATAMASGSVLYLRDPIETQDGRLTLKNFVSRELATEYSVIYRGPEDYLDIIKKAFDRSFHIGALTPMYQDATLAGNFSTQQRYILITKT
ncbi:class I SAM-dependent methyltransferase [Burkholderia diffusa]|uniref:class I SAM-dependent methyltransferase n=1 Tax=Burkholderia diffusa TaxID=488732 RepID=UPI000759778A|nr:class I SAM-dependent methyltransferase [Burkholderia diffusa]KVH43235.1 SAM-dependent methyltransferase [Burkholderia diffusa]KVN02956.1 SAM-dependent methyltransferase [Burkholderia diffusa]